MLWINERHAHSVDDIGRMEMKKFLIAVFCLLLVNSLAKASEYTGTTESAAVISNVVISEGFSELKNPEWISDGRQKFIQTCAYCHGVRGEAGKTRPFTTRKNWNPQVIHDTIANGRVNGPNVMPSWGGSISDEMIWKIVSYIKSLNADFEQAKP